MQRLCPRFPRTPIPPHRHSHPHSRQKSLGNRRTIVQDLAPCHRLVVLQSAQLQGDREGVDCGSRWGWSLWGP